MSTDHPQKFDKLVAAAERSICSGNYSEFSDVFLGSDFYDDLTQKFAPEVLEVLEKIALSESFMRSTDSDFLYAHLIGFQRMLLPEQISRFLSIVSSTYEKVSSPQTCYAMADFVGSVSPNVSGFAVLKRISGSGDAIKRECSLIGFFRLYEECSDMHMRATILNELQRTIQDSAKNVRSAAEHLLSMILRNESRRKGK